MDNAVIQLPVSEPPTEIDGLAQAFRTAEANLKQAQAIRDQAMKVLIEKVGVQEEGSFSVNTEFFKITTTGKLSRTINANALTDIQGNIPDAIFDRLFTYSPKLNLKELRYVEAKEPDIYQQVTPAITVKPGKPTVKVEVIGEK